MPELPEVEVILLGITSHIKGNTVSSVKVYMANLRWPISPEVVEQLPGQTIQTVERRGKYLLLNFQTGVLLIHLGMTGYLRILSTATAPEYHDHFDISFQDGIILRLNDVRRLGSIHWAGVNLKAHKLLADLGPEPLTDVFDGTYFYQKSRGRKITIKQFIMDHKVVAGIGNIYANEALFHAGIHPTKPAGQLSKSLSQKLVTAIKSVLTTSIKVGGTMLDFRDGTEKSGHFQQVFVVYRRGGQPCTVCSTLIQYTRLGQRSIYFCKCCQR